MNHLRKSGGSSIDLQRIWNRQVPGDVLKSAIETISPVVAIKIKDAPASVKNIGEYCKHQACWSSISNLVFDLPSSLRAELLDKDDLKQIKKDDTYIKKIDNEIEFEEKILKIIPCIVEIKNFALSRSLMSPTANAALDKIRSGKINIGQNEKKALSILFERMKEIGFEFK